MASRDLADRLLAGQAEDVVAGLLGPSPPLWSALLPADRERIARWVRQPAAHAPRPGGARLVSEAMRERRQAARLRALRDAGLLIGMALAGAAVAAYVAPPARAWLAWLSLAWLAALLVLARFAVRRATGRGITGTAESNERYFAEPEAFALGGPYSFVLGTGLAIWAMLAALAARAW